MYLSVITDEIEESIRSRRISLARKLIPLYLSESQYSDEARLGASEFYRRIFDFHSALKVLHSELKIQSWERLSSKEIQIQLQLARILNLLGASSYALRILRSCPENQKARFPFPTAGILVSNYRYSEALPFFESIDQIPERDLGYADRLRLVSLADCHSGLGESLHAQQVIQKVVRLSNEPLLLGIAYQAAGSYQIKIGNLNQAQDSLERAQKYFGSDDSTIDHGFLKKWIGAYLCLTGQYRGAKAQLAQAWAMIYRPGQKPEAWLEILYWVGLCTFLQTRKLPGEWAVILGYPGPSHELKKRIERYIDIPEEFFFSRKNATTTFDLGSDSVLRGKKTRLGLRLHERLLAYLLIAGPHGLPQFRAYEALWPEESFSFQQMQKRMEQVVSRVRERTAVQWNQSHLRFSGSPPIRCVWSEPEIPGKVFLEGRAEFERKEVEAYFSLSRRSAEYLCKRWRELGVIEVLGGRPTRYRVQGWG